MYFAYNYMRSSPQGFSRGMSRVGSSVWASDALPLAAAVEAEEEEEELVLVVSPATVDACDACSRSVMNAPLAVVSGGESAGAGRTCAAVSSSSGGSYNYLHSRNNFIRH